MSISEKLGRKLDVLSSIFCGIKINLEWITLLPIFSDLPPNMSYPTIYRIFFNPPHIIQNSGDSIPPICNWEGVSNYGYVRLIVWEKNITNIKEKWV